MKNIKQNIKKAIIIIVFLILYIYTTNITSLPSNVLLLQGESLNLKTAMGLTITQVNRNKVIRS